MLIHRELPYLSIYIQSYYFCHYGLVLICHFLYEIMSEGGNVLDVSAEMFHSFNNDV